jgi:hypothetical protein
MKRFVIAALAAASILGGGAAVAAPFHGGGGGHGPSPHGGGVHLAPVGGGFHPGGGGGFHPTGFHEGPGFHGGGPIWRGGAYHNWGYGAFLPRLWLSNFVEDFAYYDLAPPPADFEWVQDGPNALLVNLDTGQVVQVVPGAFN